MIYLNFYPRYNVILSRYQNFPAPIIIPMLLLSQDHANSPTISIENVQPTQPRTVPVLRTTLFDLELSTFFYSPPSTRSGSFIKAFLRQL